MRSVPRIPHTRHRPGFWPGGGYTYKKTLYVPKDWTDKSVVLEFEGVYEKAMVYVNDNLAATQLYGYSNFYVVLDKYLEYGQDNEIMVIANNEAEKNTRWVFRKRYLPECKSFCGKQGTYSGRWCEDHDHNRRREGFRH